MHTSPFCIRDYKSTAKLQVAYKVSSKLNEKSLSNCLENKMTKYSNLFAVVIEFRVNKIALLADMKQVFSSVEDEQERP